MTSKMPIPLSLVPIIQASVLVIYGSIVSYLMMGRISETMAAGEGFRYLATGLSVGLAWLASGWGMLGFPEQLNKGLVLPSSPAPPKPVEKEDPTKRTPILPKKGEIDTSTRASFQMTVLLLIFLESIGLFGLIVALLLVGKE